MANADTAPRPAPGSVSAACFLLYLMACLQVVVVVAVLVGLFDSIEAGAVEGGGAAESAEKLALVISAMVVVTVLGIAAFEAVLAFFIGRGKNASRIVTWVYLGLMVCCCGPSILMHRRVREGGGPRTTETGQIAQESQPAWVETLDLASRESSPSSGS